LTKDSTPAITVAAGTGFAASYTYAVGVDTVKTITMPTINFNPACPAAIRTVTSVPVLPACVTWNDNVITLNNCPYTVVGTYVVEVRKAGWVDTFNLIISCTVTSITAPAGPLAYSYTIGGSTTSGTIPAYTMTPYCG
jgi:hypothetical protein